MDSVEQRQVMEFRAKRKATLKKEFLKQYWDPHRLAKNENIFDPALQRYIAMRACQYEYFKPTFKSSKILFGFMIPYCILTYLTIRDRDDLEHRCSTGQIAYKDRNPKFMV